MIQHQKVSAIEVKDDAEYTIRNIVSLIVKTKERISTSMGTESKL